MHNAAGYGLHNAALKMAIHAELGHVQPWTAAMTEHA